MERDIMNHRTIKWLVRCETQGRTKRRVCRYTCGHCTFLGMVKPTVPDQVANRPCPTCRRRNSPDPLDRAIAAVMLSGGR